MGTPLGPKYIPYTYMDPLGSAPVRSCKTKASEVPKDMAERLAKATWGPHDLGFRVLGLGGFGCVGFGWFRGRV